MTEKNTIDYEYLTAGYEFPAQSYVLDRATLDDYLAATEETDPLFRVEGLAPPMAVTALAMAALAQSINLPSGTIHVSQELEFLKTVRVDDTITCFSKISRKLERGGLRLMNTDIVVKNQDQETVLTGKVGFVLPPGENAKKQ